MTPRKPRPHGRRDTKSKRPAGDSRPDPRIAERRATVEKKRRQARLKRTRRLVGAALAVSAVILLLGSPPLRVDRVRVEGSVRLSDSEISEVAGAEGTPMVLVDSAAVAERIRKIPQVLDVKVRTDHLRRQVVIHVVERIPVSFARVDKGFALVDSEGISVALTDTPPQGLFYLTGDIAPTEVGGARREAAMATQAAQELSSWSSTPIRVAGVGKRGIFVTTADEITVYVGGSDRMEEKGRAMRALQAKSQAERWSVRYFDVSVPDNPAVARA